MHLEHRANGLLGRKWALSLSSEPNGVREASSDAQFPKERNSQFARNRPVCYDQQGWQAQSPSCLSVDRMEEQVWSRAMSRSLGLTAKLPGAAAGWENAIDPPTANPRSESLPPQIPGVSSSGILFKADCSLSDSAF